MAQTIVGRRWQWLQETLTEAGIPYRKDGSYSVIVAHPEGTGAGWLLIRASHSQKADVRARAMVQGPGPLDGPDVAWALSLTLEELPAVALEYSKTGGKS